MLLVGVVAAALAAQAARPPVALVRRDAGTANLVVGAAGSRWSARARLEPVYWFPRARVVVYPEEPTGSLIARTVGGQILWSKKLWPYPPRLVCASGGQVLALECGKALWHAAPVDVETGTTWAVLLDLRTGAERWRKPVSAVGYPFWTNGSVFLGVRYDVSPAAVSRSRRDGAALPAWLEVRRLRDGRLIRRSRTRGVPIGVTVRRVTSGAVRVTVRRARVAGYFAEERKASWHENLPSHASVLVRTARTRDELDRSRPIRVPVTGRRATDTRRPK